MCVCVCVCMRVCVCVCVCVCVAESPPLHTQNQHNIANNYTQMGFPGGSAGEESACSVGDLGSIPGLGRSPGEGKGCPLQYSGLENSMDCYSPWGHKESDMTEQLHIFIPT